MPKDVPFDKTIIFPISFFPQANGASVHFCKKGMAPVFPLAETAYMRCQLQVLSSLMPLIKFYVLKFYVLVISTNCARGQSFSWSEIGQDSITG